MVSQTDQALNQMKEAVNQNPTILLFDVCGVISSIQLLLTDLGKNVVVFYSGAYDRETVQFYHRYTSKKYYRQKLAFVPKEESESFQSQRCNQIIGFKPVDTTTSIPLDSISEKYQSAGYVGNGFSGGINKQFGKNAADTNDTTLEIDASDDIKEIIEDFMRYLFEAQVTEQRQLNCDEMKEKANQFMEDPKGRKRDRKQKKEGF